jgi:hypothetical protein
VTLARIGGGDTALGSPEGALDHAPDRPSHPLVLVTWRDAWFDFDEADPEDARSDYLVTTVGFLVRQGPRFISIAQEILPDGDGYRAVTHIPVSVVGSMTMLRELDEPIADVGPV